MKVKNIALLVSITGFAVGFSDLRENIFFWMGRPVGAIAFIVFMIWTMLEKESALLDEQERSRLAACESRQPLPAAAVRNAKNEGRPAALLQVVH